MSHAKEMYDQRLKRINQAIALEEPDRVPVTPAVQCFPYYHAGYTMADILYDTDVSKSRESLLKYVLEYEPDELWGHPYVNIGQGPVLELVQPKTIRWAGMPGNVIDENSIHQFIEFPVLHEDEFEQFFSDRSGWTLTRGLPRTEGVFEPLANFNPAQISTFNGHFSFASVFSQPEFKDMIQTMWKVDEMNQAFNPKMAEIDRAVEEAGFPVLKTGMAFVPYDNYSDFYRGTLDGLADLYERPEEVMQYCEEELEGVLQMVKMQGQAMPGKHVFMALHKGMDGFMSDEHYRKFYWEHLQKIICAIIDAGMVPYIYTEGKYNSRLECLKEVPKGKVIYHFEEVDMVQAKKVLGDTACISGGFPVYLLNFGTKQQVIDEVKRLIDGCAGGGGFIFETSCGIDDVKLENLEAMFETVKEYGKK